MSTCNRLTSSEIYSLYRWLRDNSDRLAAKKDCEIAELAQEEVGFTVTQRNVRRIRAIVQEMRPSLVTSLPELHCGA
jgi:hypothetical protein